jgi:mannitol-1-/sugar-/sorbitol-6-phosphatase
VPLLTDVLAGADAVLLDMDGTLVDSTAVVEQMWREFAARFGLDADEVIGHAHGRQTPDTIARFVGDEAAGRAWLDHHEREELRRTDGVVEVPGAAAFVASLAVPCAVVTSAPRALAVRRLEAAGVAVPAVLVAAEDVESGKPDPEGYLRAAELLGVPAARAVVFEDAPAGILAGQRAGARVVEVLGPRTTPTGLTAEVVRDYR